MLDLKLDEAGDSLIWHQAASENRVLVSKDEDFLYFATRPDAATALVWVRLPNCRKPALLAAFERALSDSSPRWHRATHSTVAKRRSVNSRSAKVSIRLSSE